MSRWGHPLDQGVPPSWVNSWGEDKCGVFVDVEVQGVGQRMRWIPPGDFLMGSPPEEPGRFEDRETQHLVTLTQGFWLGDTPCTQKMWEAVTGSNPSRFKSPYRPVEQVSWEDCLQFFVTVESYMPGLSLRFPTEAEWEYACRAGTETATYAGEVEILGLNDAPMLDEIAWYGGNSGIDFELQDGWSIPWNEKQDDFFHAGTHPVKQRKANPWGLYDMLGNVLEWCVDWYDVYPARAVIDPTGPRTASFRVRRGGSWLAQARDIRCAYRSWDALENRWPNLGFRFVREQEVVPTGLKADL